jgi:cytochrome c551/c552
MAQSAMYKSRLLIAALLSGAASVAGAVPAWAALGHSVTDAELAPWNIDVRPDGAGLPPGRGSVADGQGIYDTQCAACHGAFGESTDYIALSGGIGSLTTSSPQRTVGSKLNYATTLWDYINRAMPFNNAKTLTPDQVYAVTAYVLNLNDIVPADAVLDAQTLPKVEMPNRRGFTTEHGLNTVDGRPDVHNTACMRDCLPGVIKITSELPVNFVTEMYPELREHFRTFTSVAASQALATDGLSTAEASGCLACHGRDQAHVGPAFTAIAPHYANVPEILTKLKEKIRHGGTGEWGSAAMPPQSAITDEKLARVLTWIMAGAPANAVISGK